MNRKCDCCWTETDDDSGWLYFAFKHLKSVWMCIACQPRWKNHHEKIQEAGL